MKQRRYANQTPIQKEMGAGEAPCDFGSNEDACATISPTTESLSPLLEDAKAEARTRPRASAKAPEAGGKPASANGSTSDIRKAGLFGRSRRSVSPVEVPWQSNEEGRAAGQAALDGSEAIRARLVELRTTERSLADFDAAVTGLSEAVEDGRIHLLGADSPPEMKGTLDEGGAAGMTVNPGEHGVPSDALPLLVLRSPVQLGTPLHEGGHFGLMLPNASVQVGEGSSKQADSAADIARPRQQLLDEAEHFSDEYRQYRVSYMARVGAGAVSPAFYDQEAPRLSDSLIHDGAMKDMPHQLEARLKLSFARLFFDDLADDATAAAVDARAAGDRTFEVSFALFKVSLIRQLKDGSPFSAADLNLP